MRVRGGVWLCAGAGLLAALAAVPRGEVRASEGPVTWSRQVAPLVYANCSGCHHPGGSGPFSLTTYAEAKRWGGLMETVTASRYMPPWLPAEGHGEFAGNRRLGEEQIGLIRRWVEAGMPEGNAAEAPRAPVYTSDWALGPPDLVLEMDSGMEVPASGTDLFRNFVFPVPIAGTRWVRAMEIKPGTPRVVHHANLIIDRTASLRRLHPADWRGGIPGMDVTVDAGEGFDPDSHFLEWKPDSRALVEPEGMAWRIDPGNDLVLNMHLKPTGKVETVRARIGLYFTEQPATKLPILLQLQHDAALDIPAGDASFTVEDQLRLPEDVDVLAIYPHAHYLGKRLEGWAALPDGETRALILIPNWDIDRQSIYRYKEPVFLPKGSVVHMRYTYDNSAANPHNPNSPPIRVKAGDRSVDEMGHLWLQVLPRSSGQQHEDARAPLLRAWMENILQKSPSDPTALFNLGALDMSEGDPRTAEELYQKALAAKPGDVRVTTALGSALARTGDWQGARTQFQAAVAADSGYADARFDLATLDLQHGEFADAERQFRALLAANAGDATAHGGLGSVLLATDRASEAQEQFETAIRLDPENFDALYNLATIEAGTGHTEVALEHLKRAAALRPGDVDTHRGLVAIYAHQGDTAAAMREQRLILGLDAADPAEWNNLGSLEARSGDPTGAQRDFRKALQLDPGNAEARANLEKMQGPPPR